MIEKTVLQEIANLSTFEEQLDFYAELKEELFYEYLDLYHLYGVILSQKKAIDHITLYEHAKNHLKEFTIEKIGQFLDVPSSAKLAQHIAQLKEIHYRKELQRIVQTNLKDLKESVTHDEAEQQRNTLIAELSGLELDNRSEFINWTEHIEHLRNNLERDKTIEGYSWGIHDLDQYTSGIVLPRMIVLGGLKKGGKSRFVMYLRRQLYEQNIPTFFLSLEMPPYEVVKLTYSTFLEINDMDLRSKNFITNEDKRRFNELKLNTGLMPVECASSLDIDSIITRLRRYSRIHPASIVFIDFLQRIRHNRNNQAAELEDISQRIADATRSYGITVILLSQLSNLAERDGVSIGTLKGSGGIGEAADLILLLDNVYRRTKNEADKGLIDFYIEQRYGDSGKVRVSSDLGMCKFQNYVEGYSDYTN